MTIRQFIDAIYPLQTASRNLLLETLTKVRLRRGVRVIDCGVRSEQVWMVTKGIFRVGCVDCHGVETTIGFGSEGATMSATTSLFFAGRSHLLFETLTPVVAWTTDRERMVEAMGRDGQVCRWLMFWVAEQLCSLEYTLSAYHGDTYGRLKEFMNARRDIAGQLPLKLVAEYLGVRPETVSRLRRRLAEDG